MKKKYDCNKTLDYVHERDRMCNSFCNCHRCNTCPLYIFSCDNVEAVNAEKIKIVQEWSDAHPEIKLTEKEKIFLECFGLISNEETIVMGMLGYPFLKSPDGRNLYNLTDDMFSFLEVGEEISFKELLRLK